jgi:hypothetical protein
VTDAEAAEWAALADAVTEGSWTASGRTVLGDGYGAEYVSIPDTPADAAFIASAWAAVPRLLADRERLTGEVAQLREDLSRLASEWERELTSDHRPASALEAELDPAEFRTKPNPDQPDRCPSIDPTTRSNARAGSTRTASASPVASRGSRGHRATCRTLSGQPHGGHG